MTAWLAFLGAGAFHKIVDIVFGWGGVLGLVSAAAFAAYVFIPQIPWITYSARKIALYVGIAAGASAVAYGFVFSKGYEKHEEAVERVDDRAVERTEIKVRNVRECYEKEGTWDATRGRCSR